MNSKWFCGSLGFCKPRKPFSFKGDCDCGTGKLERRMNSHF